MLKIIKLERKHQKVEVRAGVAYISAGVHSGYQLVTGDIRLTRSDPLQVKK